MTDSVLLHIEQIAGHYFTRLEGGACRLMQITQGVDQGLSFNAAVKLNTVFNGCRLGIVAFKT